MMKRYPWKTSIMKKLYSEFIVHWKKETVLKIIAGVVLLACAPYFWAQYEKQIPRTREETAAAALAEVKQIPAEIPLTLITEPDDGMGAVRDAIDTASATLDLVMYELNDVRMEQALVDAQNRGVKVRVILQNVNIFGTRPNQRAYDFLKNQGVSVIWAQKYFFLTHQKTLIMDNAWAMIMTFNLDSRYYGSSRDFAVADKDSEDVAAIAAAFESDWNGSQIAADNGRDLVWSPGSADTLLALIDSASESLDVYNEEMADPRITAALESAARKGVAVRVDMTYASQWKPALNELSAAGVHVRTYGSGAKLYIHAKAIMADGERAFLGSENFSAASLDANRELGILISRPDILASLERTFEKDWLASRPFANPAATASSPHAAVPVAKTAFIKLSKSHICHAPDSPSYIQTKNFTPYATLDECLAAGGRLPAHYQR